MDLLKETFDHYHPDKSKLKAYGFHLHDGVYHYEKDIAEGFQARISVDGDRIRGKVIEKDLDEEYLNINAENVGGAFAAQLRERYSDLLIDIRNSCFVEDQFYAPQAERISEYIRREYGDKAQYPHRNFPKQAVFNDRNGRSYAVIERRGNQEILGLKAEARLLASLKDEPYIVEAYHLDKKKWYGIVLDDHCADEMIFSLIDHAHSVNEEADAWLVPANVQYYDVIHCFDEKDTLLWKQSAYIHSGDIVYLYVGKPYSAILYKCSVLKTDIPYNYQDANIRMSRVMELQLLKRFREDSFTFAYLNSIGVKMVRGTRKLSREQWEKLG